MEGGILFIKKRVTRAITVFVVFGNPIILEKINPLFGSRSRLVAGIDSWKLLLIAESELSEYTKNE